MFILLIKSKDILNSIGIKIKNARLAKGYTQEALSERINISSDLLRNIENARNIGSLPTLLNLCNELDITPNYLFSDLIKIPDTEQDTILHSLLSKISKKDKSLLKQIIIHIDQNY